MRHEAAESVVRKALPDIFPALGAMALQLVACAYFVTDAMADEAGPAPQGAAGRVEVLIALALLAGVVLGAAYIFRLIREIRLRDATVTIARGALVRLLAERFIDWGLSAAEPDVALFALKGCTVAEIATMRSAAPGTVRAQLSQVYAKAGVSSQVMLMSLFLEDLMSGTGTPTS